MFGTGIGHYIPLLAYTCFVAMCFVALFRRPLWGLYYMIPFLPYRTMRDHLNDYPLGGNLLTILVICVIIGALIKGKRLPKSKVYLIWLISGIYLYLSMWFGTALGNAPPPIWLSDMNFVTWKDYMLIPLVLVAASLVVEDRRAVRTVILMSAVSVFLIDRTCILESLSHTWSNYDENKRSGGPLGFGSNQTAAYLAQFAMFFWGLVQFIKRRKAKLICYGLVALSVFADLYTFSRASYLALLVGIFILAILKDRKLLILIGVFLIFWQAIVPTAVRERVNMTENQSGQLERSAQERVDLWQEAEDSFMRSPVLGSGYATYQFGRHVDGLEDTHNWYVKVAVETGLIGLALSLLLVQQMISIGYRLFRKAEDPLYKGLGLGLLLAVCTCAVTNFFGDRWTYLEITAPLWVLTGVAIRAYELKETAQTSQSVSVLDPIGSVNPYMVYR